MSYFPQWHTNKNKMEVELNLSNYATKSDFKNAAGADTVQFAKKDDLAYLESDVDKLDFDELRKVPSGLTTL